MDDAFGGLGRVLVHRYHPDCSSSHPVLQVCFRCNFDVQCTDRVFVCSARREVFRKRRVRKSAAAGEEDEAEDGWERKEAGEDAAVVAQAGGAV